MSAARSCLRMLLVPAALGIALIATACAGPILARPAAPTPSIPAPTATPKVPNDPQPIAFPRDDGPHDRLTEWWYYTGHLTDQDGGTWGFEYVIFRAERGGFPVSWASHIAITDETGGTFTYAQRSTVGSWVDTSPIGPDGMPTGFDFAIVDYEAPHRPGDGLPAWSMTGGGGRDRLSARVMSTEQTSSAEVVDIVLDLQLSTDRPPALHDDDGWIDFGPAGGSYYYSRTRMGVSGLLTVGDRDLQVEGIAWFDHQWGDFIAVGGGCWDWFAVNLDDGTDVTVSVVRDVLQRAVFTYATIVDADGSTRHVSGDAITLAPRGSWTSGRTGATYPAGWSIFIASENLALELSPTVADQELDTRATTGVVYWEGSQRVSGTRGGVPIGGVGYVELTGYAN